MADGYHHTERGDAADHNSAMPQSCGQPLAPQLEKHCSPVADTFHSDLFDSESVNKARVDCTIRLCQILAEKGSLWQYLLRANLTPKRLGEGGINLSACSGPTCLAKHVRILDCFVL
jgi:hypothetical protein